MTKRHKKSNTPKTSPESPAPSEERENMAPETTPELGESVADDANVPRRSLLTRVWIALGVVALLEYLGLGFTNLWRKATGAKSESAPEYVAAGPVSDFEPGSVTPFVGDKFYLVRLEDGGFLAVSRKCTHLGCTVPWDETQSAFACPCHASRFDIAGDVLNPPATRALDRYAVVIEDGVVKVDVSQAIRRAKFDKSQVAQPNGRSGAAS